MLGHWGEKTNVRDIQEKNPVIRNVPDEYIGEKHGEEKYWQKHETNIWCNMRWLKRGGKVMFIL